VEFLIEFKTLSDSNPFTQLPPGEFVAAPDTQSGTSVAAPDTQSGTSVAAPDTQSGTSAAPAPGQSPFLNDSPDGCMVAGQITAYATLILSAQYRTHVFLVLIFKRYS
jgi:hypothetical protein